MMIMLEKVFISFARKYRQGNYEKNAYNNNSISNSPHPHLKK